MTIDAAAFWINWTDLRQVLDFPCGFNAIINSGKARSRDGELEITAKPLDSLSITASVGYTDARILSTGPLISVPAAGSAIEQVAPWTAAASAEYKHALGANLTGVLRADYSYVDRSFSANIDPTQPRLRPPYELTNLRAGVRRDRWEITRTTYSMPTPTLVIRIPWVSRIRAAPGGRRRRHARTASMSGCTSRDWE
jgi:iron complex outermembrane receptor protein